MNNEEIEQYIKSYNLDIRTIEQIISFLNDGKYCKIGWYDKRDIVQFVYGERFNEVWKDIQDEIKNRRKSLYNK